MAAPLTRSGRPNTSGTRSGVVGQSPFPLALEEYDKDNEQKFRSQLEDVLEPLRRQLSKTATLLAAIKASTVINDSTVTGAFVADALNWLLNNMQPLDSDLTAIAALVTTSFGRSLLTSASALSARGSSFLNIEGATGHGDSNYTILATDRYVFTNAAFTAARTWTLPAANSINAGGCIIVSDQQGTLTNANTLTVSAAGSDKLDGAVAGGALLKTAFDIAKFYSDGVSNWTFERFIFAGTSANQLVQLDGNSKLPAVDGSALTNLPNDNVVPTIQALLSGSTNYTPTAGTKYIRVRMSGGGGGGGASTVNAGGTGGTTTFGSWTAIGGTGGGIQVTGVGGAGGTGGATGTGTLVVRLQGGSGTGCGMGGNGGCNPFGGGGGGGNRGNSPGLAASVNTGGGGGGAGDSGSSLTGAAGGGAGEYVEFYVNAPGVTAYTVGAAGTGGAAGTVAGGNGGSGVILIEEFH